MVDNISGNTDVKEMDASGSMGNMRKHLFPPGLYFYIEGLQLE